MKTPIISWKALGPFVIGIATPLLLMVVLSFIPLEEGDGIFSGFAELFTEVRLSEITQILLRAFFVSFFATIIAFVISYFLVIHASRKFRTVFFVSITLPFLVNESVRVFSWQTVLSEDGWFNSILSTIAGHEVILFDGSNATNVYIVMILSCVPFGIFIFSAALLIIKDRYWKIADDLKMNATSKFLKVLFPYSKLAIIASFFVIFFISMAMSSEANFLSGDTKISTRNLVLSMMSASKFQAIFAFGSVILLVLSVAAVSFRRFNLNRTKS